MEETMTVDVYSVHFARINALWRNRNTGDTVPVFHTTCLIQVVDPEVESTHWTALGQGQARMDSRDAPRDNPIKGRRIALVRALANARLDKYERTVIWNEFVRMHGIRGGR